MRGFFQRGGHWILGQTALFIAIVVLGIRFRGPQERMGSMILGILLMLLGTGVAVAGILALGRNLTPFPKPIAKAQLVQQGIYSFVRHPIYAAVILIAIGWAIFMQSWPSLVASLMLLPLLSAKAGREERWLREKFPEYSDYERRVGRFFPRL